jgi:hypothetical protein
MMPVRFLAHDWTADERAEIRRLEKFCEASDDWILECSHTDAGDPWCVVYDERHQRSVVHIARFEGRLGDAACAARRQHDKHDGCC